MTRALLLRLSDRLRRSTSGGGFIPEIDGLRFFSIAFVILYHAPYHHWPGAPPLYGRFAFYGNFGVQMFFAISGFILGLPFAEAHILGTRTVSLRRYFVRRLTRLEPPYIINLVIWFALKIFVLRHRTFSWLLPHLLASLTYTHNVIYGAPSEVNLFAWSLEVEVQFYILAPLLSLVFTLPRPARLAILAAAIVGTSQVVVDPPLSFRGQAQWFLVGFLLVDLYLVSWKRRPTQTASWDIVTLLVWPLIFACLGVSQENASTLLWRASLFAIPWLLLAGYVAAFRGPLTRRTLRWAPIYIVGGMCYSIYLYHGYVLEAVVALQRKYALTGSYWLNTFAGLTAIAVAVLVTCSLAFVFFEKPFMNPRWHVELWNRMTGRGGAPSAPSAVPQASE
ncbi:MAG TPA: acyltransferase [Polyangiaceae bacterium]|jgi:peptidoglycan/LPS O-acetylase OafA/YrhL